MADEFFGIRLGDAQAISGKLKASEAMTQGALPELFRADEEATQGINSLISGSTSFEEGLGNILKARTGHIEQAIQGIHTALQALPAAMQGRPSASLEHTLTIWNGGVSKVSADLETIQTTGQRVTNEINKSKADFKSLQTALQDLEATLKNMIAALGQTHGALDQHIAGAESVMTQGANTLNTFGG